MLRRNFLALALSTSAFQLGAFVVPVMAQDGTAVVLRTDYKYNGYIAPFALALDRGYYAEAGLDVSIEQGQGSGTTVQTVGAGTDDFGVADASTAILGITAQNIPVKLISVYTQTATMGLIYHAKDGFSGNAADLKGKIIISSAGSADLRLLEPALASAGMTLGDVDLQLVDPNARVPLFLRTPGAFLTGFATGDFLRVTAHEADAGYVPYADFGVTAYGTGLVASDDTIANRPEVVRAFVVASQKGWDAAIADPAAAVDASLKLYPDLDPAMIRAGLDIALSSQLHTAATEGKPVGWTEEADWVKTIDVLTKYAGLEPSEVSRYYTNDFIAQ